MGRSALPAIERKSLAGVQVVEDRVVTGFAAVVGNVDDGGDVLLPGAFAKTLTERADRLRYLWMHDASQMPTANIVGIAEVGKDELPAELLAKFPDAIGGLKVSREYLETPRGEEAFVGVRKGAIQELSFAYDVIAAGTPDEVLRWGKGAKRLLKEVRLWECSDVNWGMNPATMNVKATAAAGLLTELPKEPGPVREKALAEWFEARLHLENTQMLDYMYGDGFLTRAEWSALTELLGQAVEAFHAGIVGSEDLQGVRTRGRWESAPMPADGHMEDAGEMARKAAPSTPPDRTGKQADRDLAPASQVSAAKAAAVAMAERRRRVQVALSRLEMVRT